MCLFTQTTPKQWRAAKITCLYKKGDVDDCNNYRPISLLCVTYKLFAAMLLARIKAAGAESRLTSTQFGFRTGCGTTDSIFAVRRRMDLALAQRNRRVHLLALDWQKAFDSISPASLILALRRFGLPEQVLNLIRLIYGTFYSDGSIITWLILNVLLIFTTNMNQPTVEQMSHLIRTYRTSDGPAQGTK